MYFPKCESISLDKLYNGYVCECHESYWCSHLSIHWQIIQNWKLSGQYNSWQRNPSSEKEKCMVASLPGTLPIILNLKLIFAVMSPDFYSIIHFFSVISNCQAQRQALFNQACQCKHYFQLTVPPTPLNNYLNYGEVKKHPAGGGSLVL